LLDDTVLQLDGDTGALAQQGCCSTACKLLEKQTELRQYVFGNHKAYDFDRIVHGDLLGNAHGTKALASCKHAAATQYKATSTFMILFILSTSRVLLNQADAAMRIASLYAPASAVEQAQTSGKWILTKGCFISITKNLTVETYCNCCTYCAWSGAACAVPATQQALQLLDQNKVGF
jgi:hypothetical protein